VGGCQQKQNGKKQLGEDWKAQITRGEIKILFAHQEQKMGLNLINVVGDYSLLGVLPQMVMGYMI